MVYYLGERDRVVICCMNPAFGRVNRRELNLDAHPIAKVQIRGEADEYGVRVVTDLATERTGPNC